jgi:hypothetical protein
MQRRSFLKSTFGFGALATIQKRLPIRLLNLATTARQPVKPNTVTPVLTRSYNNARSCANPGETTLTVQNVTTRGIKRLYSLATPSDLRCEAQPLIVPNVTMADGSAHDLVILATMGNHVMAYDYDTNNLHWDVSLGTPIKGTKQIDSWAINENWGILSTPVVDPAANILYCVAWTSPTGQSNNATHYLHAIRLRDGTDEHPPLSLAGATCAPGNGLPVQKFSSIPRKQRCGLLLTNVNGVKTVFLGCGSVNETNKLARGWVIAVDLAAFKIAAAFATTARYSGGGIWQAAQGLSADSKGFIHCMTGNGAFDGKTEWGECILKLQYVPAQGGQPAALKVYDWWSPFSDSGRAGKDPTLPSTNEGGDDQAANGGEFVDQDLGSGGPVCVEDYGLLAGAGKDGILYVTHLNNMGKTSNKDFANPAINYAKLASPPIWFTSYPGDGISAQPQDITQLNKNFNNLTHHQHSTPVVYDSPVHGKMLFTWGENGNLRAWTIAQNGTLIYLACSAELASPASANDGHFGGMPGGMLSLSCNGATAGTGLLWALVPQGDANREHTPGFLYCYDADNFGTFPDGSKQIRLLWNSQQWGLNFTHPKFNVPIVCGGKIFIPTYDGRVDVYGLA